MNQAHWHLMLNHFPVTGTLFGIVIWLSGWRLKEGSMQRVALGWMILMGLITIPVYLTGQNAHEIIHDMPGVSHDIIDQHAQWALYALIAIEASALLALIGLWKHRPFSREISHLWKGAILIAAFLGFAFAFYTAHLGGQIRHTETRPGFVPPVPDEAHEHHAEEHEHHHE